MVNQIVAGLKRGHQLYIEKCRHIPYGLLINTVGFSVLSILMAHLFAGSGETHIYDDRSEYVSIAFFSYLMLQSNFFAAFGESWRDKKHVLNSNYTLLELNVSHLFHAFVHIGVFLVVLSIFFENSYRHLFFFATFLFWLIGLRQVAYITGGMARWIGRTGALLGRAFFVISPILWVPVNERQTLLSDYNPLVILLLNSGISWAGQGAVNLHIILYSIFPVYVFIALSKPFLRRWLCEKLY